MEFLKKIFNDDDYVVGLSGFKDLTKSLPHKDVHRRTVKSCYNIFTPTENLVFITNTKDNFLLS